MRSGHGDSIQNRPQHGSMAQKHVFISSIINNQYYNKNQGEVYPCLEIQVNCFCVGIFHESEGQMKYPFTKQ